MSKKKEQLAQFNILAAPVLEWLRQGAPHVTVNKSEIGFDMATVNSSIDATDYKNNTCGTACCIAGAIGQFNYKSDILKPLFKEIKKRDGYDKLSDTLDSSIEVIKRAFPKLSNELETLFMGGDYDLYDITPDHAYRTLKKFMETGEVNWD